MAARQELEALFLSHLGAIERIAGAICRRHGMAGDDAADFGSWVKLKLVENDYAVLGKFRGESSLGTYLTVVIAMLARDYRVQRWGRWRPSAAARRRGRIAVQLETLVYRDGHRLDQAAEVLRTRGETALSDRDLAAMFAALPVRGPMRPLEVGAEPLTAIPAPEVVDDGDRDRVDETLFTALDRLPPEERAILRMRYWEGMSIADIARGLGMPQKPLYRRIERALAELRRHVEASGVSRHQAMALIGELDQ
ncbi:MAG TPA: sigma-70 family RNA polymerase sigma factor [Gemmatimonadaceae bacterium]|jgi:RNA polymerase sigma factor (sigma-70 family)|nr:sigma-70 family RNA polymerase sigma factor [Gemmatimonadaceae bacterium]